MKSVFIKICDEGWIIEEMAARLTGVLDYAEYGLHAPEGAALLYYLPYLTYAGKAAPREAGFFTHQEADPVRKARFLEAARAFDHCVCQSRRYADLLRAEPGVRAVSVISPGVDLEAFTPEVRIGVVGRTYDSGRKGEAILTPLLDLPGIRWRFTGKGWPLPSEPVPPGGMPDFYRSVDYVLVPSLIEGGPMCVIEALACGKEVIAPAVGWADEFPHIPYRLGDVDSLRAVLNDLVRRRHALRQSVLSRTWDAWADAHDRLFRTLLAHDPDHS